MTDYEKAYSRWKSVSQMHRTNTNLFRQGRQSVDFFLVSKKAFDEASSALDKVPYAEHNDNKPANISNMEYEIVTRVTTNTNNRNDLEKAISKALLETSVIVSVVDIRIAKVEAA